MGQVIKLKRRKPREALPRGRRVTLVLRDPLLEQVERLAKEAGVTVQHMLKFGTAQTLARHEREVRAAREAQREKA